MNETSEVRVKFRTDDVVEGYSITIINGPDNAVVRWQTEFENHVRRLTTDFAYAAPEAKNKFLQRMGDSVKWDVACAKLSRIRYYTNKIDVPWAITLRIALLEAFGVIPSDEYNGVHYQG